eukprot:2699338-Alexandrium_andersonii.AAC.1
MDLNLGRPHNLCCNLRCNLQLLALQLASAWWPSKTHNSQAWSTSRVVCERPSKAVPGQSIRWAALPSTTACREFLRAVRSSARLSGALRRAP